MRLVHQILVHVQTPKKLVSPLLQSLLPLVVQCEGNVAGGALQEERGLGHSKEGL